MQGAFRYIHDTDIKQLKNLPIHLDPWTSMDHSLASMRKKGKKPKKHDLTFPVVNGFVCFLKNFTEHYGISHSTLLQGRFGMPPTYLPAANTVTSQHKVYLELCGECGKLSGINSFRSIWQDCFPHQVIMAPCTDVPTCSYCEDLQRKVHLTATALEKHVTN